MQQILERFVNDMRHALRQEILEDIRTATLLTRPRQKPRTLTTTLRKPHKTGEVDEQAILAALPGQMRHIQHKTKESRARLSKTLKELRKKGLVRMEGNRAGAIWERTGKA